MNLLLDLHVFIWWACEPERLSARVREAIRDPKTRAFLSAASAWELAIKFRLGKLRLPEPPEQFLPSRLARNRIEELPVRHAHALGTLALPPIHRDPFDRLLVAQAKAEGLSLVTVDENVLRYGGEVIDAR
ncbi:MAG: type II toxin-antitoxin system VapC family toxin [Planctomycetota bacterium]